jgi:CTP-dependent riboflavin kinase
VRSLRHGEGHQRGGGLTSACSRRRRGAEPGSYESDVCAFAAEALIVRGMSELLAGRVQTGLGDASRWLKLFNAAYSAKLRMSLFPGSLNIALDHVFDWFDARYEAHRIWFGRKEYGGERDTLLLPCKLVSLDHRRAFLWTPTTAARDRRDPWVVEIVADVNLRDQFGLQDGDLVEVRVPTSGVQR